MSPHSNRFSAHLARELPLRHIKNPAQRAKIPRGPLGHPKFKAGKRSGSHREDPACAAPGPVLCLTPLQPVHMINWILKKIIGSKNTRLVKRLRPLVERINALEVEFQKLSE